VGLVYGEQDGGEQGEKWVFQQDLSVDPAGGATVPGSFRCTWWLSQQWSPAQSLGTE
jgi:hypothetical protein